MTPIVLVLLFIVTNTLCEETRPGEEPRLYLDNSCFEDADTVTLPNYDNYAGDTINSELNNNHMDFDTQISIVKEWRLIMGSRVLNPMEILTTMDYFRDRYENPTLDDVDIIMKLTGSIMETASIKHVEEYGVDSISHYIATFLKHYRESP